MAGFAKGGATVRLESEVTILHYEVDARIGGKLAQLGQRLIDSTAKKPPESFLRHSGRWSVGVEATPAGADAAPKGWLSKLTGAA